MAGLSKPTAAKQVLSAQTAGRQAGSPAGSPRARTPAATLVLRSASSSVVLPWSTCPITVTTAGRGTASASSRASLPPRLPATSTANFPNSRAASSAASGGTRSCRELHCSPSSASTSSTRSSGASVGGGGGGGGVGVGGGGGGPPAVGVGVGWWEGRQTKQAWTLLCFQPASESKQAVGGWPTRLASLTQQLGQAQDRDVFWDQHLLRNLLRCPGCCRRLLSRLALLVAAGRAAACLLLLLLGAGEGGGEGGGQLSRENALEGLEGRALPLLPPLLLLLPLRMLLLVVVVLLPLRCIPSSSTVAAAILAPREAGRCWEARRRRPAAKVLRRPCCALLLPRAALLPLLPAALLLLPLLLLPCMRRPWRLWWAGTPRLLRPLLIWLLLVLLLVLLLLAKARGPSGPWPAVGHAPGAIGAAGAAASPLAWPRPLPLPRPWLLLLWVLLLRRRRLCQAQLLQKESRLWPARGARGGACSKRKVAAAAG